MRAETGADIVVGKEDDLITITGGEFRCLDVLSTIIRGLTRTLLSDAESVGFAKDAILSIATRSGGRF